jgi:NADH-quinone oxidoreductase subunit K
MRRRETERISSGVTRLYRIGRIGRITNRQNVLMILRCVEILRLAVNLEFRILAVSMDDRNGRLWMVRVLTVAGAEASVGLAVLVVYYRVHGSLAMSSRNVLHG